MRRVVVLVAVATGAITFGACADAAGDPADEDAYSLAIVGEARAAQVDPSLALDIGETLCGELDDPVFRELGLDRGEREFEVQSSALASAEEGGAGPEDMQFISAALGAAFEHLCPR